MADLKSIKAYQWISSLYFFQSMPFVVVSLIATIFYQQQGLDNTQSALITSCLVLPWAIKPVFAPYLEKISTKKRLTIFTQGLISCLFLLLALGIDRQYTFRLSILAFSLLAFTSSLHDIVSDGVYLINLDGPSQKRYIALRSLFYQMGRLVIKGGLLTFVAQIANYFLFNTWQVFFYCLFIMAFVLTICHVIKIPEIEAISTQVKKNPLSIYKSLMASKQFSAALIFIFLYNCSDAQMQKIVPLFLLDKMGLNLGLFQFGQIYGVYGSIALIIGIFFSGFLLSRFPLQICLKRITILLLLGHFCFLFLTLNSPSMYAIYLTMIFSQFAFGLANGAYMGYLLLIANQSKYPMSMYTVCTATMALSYVIFGSFSGWLEQQLGYQAFFFAILFVNLLLVLLTFKRMDNHDRLA
ncbi:MAG: MFS transporter [Tatlockia sp.]|nr:MFS transporter [Tatlockia sp.]